METNYQTNDSNNTLNPLALRNEFCMLIMNQYNNFMDEGKINPKDVEKILKVMNLINDCKTIEECFKIISEFKINQILYSMIIYSNAICHTNEEIQHLLMKSFLEDNTEGGNNPLIIGFAPITTSKKAAVLCKDSQNNYAREFICYNKNLNTNFMNNEILSKLIRDKNEIVAEAANDNLKNITSSTTSPTP